MAVCSEKTKKKPKHICVSDGSLLGSAEQVFL